MNKFIFLFSQSETSLQNDSLNVSVIRRIAMKVLKKTVSVQETEHNWEPAAHADCWLSGLSWKIKLCHAMLNVGGH